MCSRPYLTCSWTSVAFTTQPVCNQYQLSGERWYSFRGGKRAAVASQAHGGVPHPSPHVALILVLMNPGLASPIAQSSHFLPPSMCCTAT